MSTEVPAGSTADATSPPRRTARQGSGGTTFAGTMLLVIGSYQALIGIPALLNDTIYVTDAGHLYAFDLTAWGWVHLLLGAVVALVGLAIMRGAAWARWAGIAVVVLSLSVNFLFLPYYPLWSVVTIALDLAVLAALVMDRSDGH